jgi:hypothetical protein
MGKIHKRIHRADALQDHRHAMADGRFTGGMLLKPNRDQAGWHTHLYQDERDTLETEEAQNDGDHTHETIMGDTTGPMALRTDALEPARDLKGYVQRRGHRWVAVSATGHVLATEDSAGEAAKHLTGT